MATETLLDGVEVEAVGSTKTNMSIIGSSGAAVAAAGHVIEEQ